MSSRSTHPGITPDDGIASRIASHNAAGRGVGTLWQSRRRLVAAWIAIFAASLSLYAVTASRSIGWQDFGHFVQRVVDDELVNPLGLALSHPLHYWISYAAVTLMPESPPHAMALLSGLFGAMTVANVACLIRYLTGRWSPSLPIAAGLLLAHTFWRMSTMVECYSLSAALLTAQFWCVLCWDQQRRPAWLVLLFLLSGLDFSNHNLALLALPAFGIILLYAVARRQISPVGFMAAATAWIVGAAPYLGLILHQYLASGQAAATIRSALFGHSYAASALSIHISPTHLLITTAFVTLSFPNLIIPAALAGALPLRHAAMPRLFRRALLAVLLLHLLFILRYNVQDQYTFLVPAFGLVAILAGSGADIVQRSINRRPRIILTGLAWLLTLATPFLYMIVPELARAGNVLGDAQRYKPYRDDYHYLFIPWGVAHTSAHRMSAEAVGLAGPDGAIIVEDGMARFAVRYQLVRHHWEAVPILTAWDQSILAPHLTAGHPIVLVPARTDRPPPPPTLGTWQRRGDLYVLSQ